ncbi:hypothetical protein NFI96_006514, partial [Prochilodus magdalenae]
MDGGPLLSPYGSVSSSCCCTEGSRFTLIQFQLSISLKQPASLLFNPIIRLSPCLPNMSRILAKLDPRRVQWSAFHSRVLRTKPVESMLDSSAGTAGTGPHGTRLARVLTTVDLVSLGVGSCVGTGMYVVSGLVAKEMAGPGVIVSFIIAAVASILS